MASRTWLWMLLVLFTGLMGALEAYQFKVGGNQGWVLNPSENYNQWSQRMRFQVNDSLFFKYNKGTDSVLVVNKQDYDTCNTQNPIMKMDGGDSTFKFDRSGPFYFISGNKDNCDKGQKLTVVVLAVRNPKTPNLPPTPPMAQTPATSPTHAPPMAQTPAPMAQTPAISPTHAPPMAQTPATSPAHAPPMAQTPATSPAHQAKSPATAPSPATSTTGSPSPATVDSPTPAKSPATSPESPSPATVKSPTPATSAESPSPATVESPSPATSAESPSPATVESPPPVGTTLSPGTTPVDSDTAPSSQSAETSHKSSSTAAFTPPVFMVLFATLLSSVALGGLVASP